MLNRAVIVRLARQLTVSHRLQEHDEVQGVVEQTGRSTELPLFRLIDFVRARVMMNNFIDANEAVSNA